MQRFLFKEINFFYNFKANFSEDCFSKLYILYGNSSYVICVQNSVMVALYIYFRRNLKL